MGVEESVRSWVVEALGELAQDGFVPEEAARASFSVERPKRPEHGDLATNAAMAIQKIAKKPPRDIAAALAKKLEAKAGITAVEIAGPGFLNLRLSVAPYHAVLGEVLTAGKGYGRAAAATGERILLEFVSANPTGPLLISHGRGAILGDAVGSLLEAAGHRVVREYYINDFGNQIRLLALSVRAMIKNEPTPEGGYSSDYVRELADWLIANQPAVANGTDDAELARAAVTRMLDGVPGSKVLPGIKRTLADLRIFHDSWYSEESLHRWGRVAAALGELEKKGYMEEREGALFFKSTEEGDDKDRVVRKKDGDYTYFASDIAYHADKVRRGYDRLITVLGADHHGYTARVRGALAALGLPKEKYEVLLFQLVSLLRDGVPYRMGKRLGNFITIEEVVEEIDEAAKRQGAGADALRYFYLARRTETPIDLDIEIAKKATLENPVFYLQYGYARLGSILRRAKEVFGLDVPAATPALVAKLVHPKELQILGTLGRFPALIREAAEGREPHRIITYLNELSQDFQSYFTHLKTQGDAILPQTATTSVEGWEKTWDRDKTRARLVWIDAIRSVYASGLAIAGISAPERMERLSTPSIEQKAASAEEEEDA